MRAVDKSARVPGERLWPILVGVKFIDGEAVVARRCKSQCQHRTQHRRCGDDLSIDRMAWCVETARGCRQHSSFDDLPHDANLGPSGHQRRQLNLLSGAKVQNYQEMIFRRSVHRYLLTTA